MTAEKIRTNAKQPDPVDVHVGGRIRAGRLLRGISQGVLGARIGVTFQQVQKYELGINRVSASRLQLLATVLGTNVAYFFEGLGEGDTDIKDEQQKKGPLEFAVTSETLRLNEAFLRIRDPKIRSGIVALAKALANGDEEASPSC